MTIQQLNHIRNQIPIEWQRVKRELIDAIQLIDHEPQDHQVEFLRARIASLRDLFDYSMQEIQQIGHQFRFTPLSERKLAVLSLVESIAFFTGAIGTGTVLASKEEQGTPWFQTTFFVSCLFFSQVVSKCKDVLMIRRIHQATMHESLTEAKEFFLTEEPFLRAFEKGLLIGAHTQQQPVMSWEEKRMFLLFLANRDPSAFVNVDLRHSTEHLPLLS